ncbi:hypothetical protein JCM3765_007634 [Sporobolomyces pararoseus]
MKFNYTGGARKSSRRVSLRYQQDLTGTAAYNVNQHRQGNGRRRGARGRSSSRGNSSSFDQRGAKRRKTDHYQGGVPDFDFAHAKRDKEDWRQRSLEREDRLRFERNYYSDHSSLTNTASTGEYGQNSGYARDTFETHQHSTPHSARETHSTQYIWQDYPEDLDGYSQVQMAQANRESSILRNSSIQPSLPSENAFDLRLPFQLPQKRPSESYYTCHDSYTSQENFLRPPPPHRPSTQMSSHSSNPASLSIISTPPLLLPCSTTPAGTPPPLRSFDNGPRSRQIFAAEEASQRRSNESIDTNAPCSSLVDFSVDNREQEEHQTSIEPSNASNQLDSSLSNLQLSSSPPPATDHLQEAFEVRIEQIASQASDAFSVLPPQIAEWTGPCCVTRFQRDQLASSFNFTNKLLEGDEGEEPLFVSDRMGVGCRGISQEKAIELIQFEVSLRSNCLDLPFEDTGEEEEEVGRFEELEWEEGDFEEQDQESSSSHSRRPPDPPPVPLFDNACTDSDPLNSVVSGRRNITLSNGPWNDETEDESRNLIEETFNLDSSTDPSDSAPAPPLPTSVCLDQLEDYEDISTRWKLLHYESAYEPLEEGAIGDRGVAG